MSTSTNILQIINKMMVKFSILKLIPMNTPSSAPAGTVVNSSIYERSRMFHPLTSTQILCLVAIYLIVVDSIFEVISKVRVVYCRIMLKELHPVFESFPLTKGVILKIKLFSNCLFNCSL